MAKPVRIYVDREDYHWMVERFGNDGVRPLQCVLGHRLREHIETLDKKVVK